jgi:hypothetical protein
MYAAEARAFVENAVALFVAEYGGERGATAQSGERWIRNFEGRRNRYRGMVRGARTFGAGVEDPLTLPLSPADGGEGT